MLSVGLALGDLDGGRLREDGGEPDDHSASEQVETRNYSPLRHVDAVSKVELGVGGVFPRQSSFRLGELEAAGRTPAWVSPANRRADRGIKTDRAVAQKSVYKFVPPNRATLLWALSNKGGGISLVDNMQLEDLKQLHKVVFGSLSANGYVWCSHSWRSNISPLLLGR